MLCGIKSFDLALLGLEGEFSVHNEMLVDFLLNSKYETISVYLAHILRKLGIRKVARTFYQPAQDFLAELPGKNSHESIVVAKKNVMPRREYCETIIDALLAIDRHIAEGREMGLHIEEIYLHDEIFGCFQPRFDADVLAVAGQFFHVLCYNDSFRITDYDADLDMEEQSATCIESVEYSMCYFYSELANIREEFLPAGWLNDNSLSVAYLTAHAERILTGGMLEE